jgi:hypothetical protein
MALPKKTDEGARQRGHVFLTGNIVASFSFKTRPSLRTVFCLLEFAAEVDSSEAKDGGSGTVTGWRRSVRGIGSDPQ